MKPITIILNPGHGENTPGKRYTFDGVTLYEWQYSRELARRIKLTCDQLGIKCIIINDDKKDIALKTRANNINKIVRQESEQGRHCLMISLHGNASAKHDATGWEAWTTVGTTNSDTFANLLCKHFPIIFPDRKLRGHKEKNYTVIYNTACPCVLTENFFYDYRPDFDLMTSEAGLQKITDLHMAAICDYIEYDKN